MILKQNKILFLKKECYAVFGVKMEEIHVIK